MMDEITLSGAARQLSFEGEPREMSVAGCGGCLCRSCLYWWSSRCPYGECWDDHRAKVAPYDKSHPEKPPRTGWSEWKSQQSYWCRGGVFYPQTECERYVKYTDQTVETCLKANVSRFQDGYISCPIIDTFGCRACLEEVKKRKRSKQK